MKFAKIIPLSISLTFLLSGFAKVTGQGAGEITTMSTNWGKIQISQEECITKAAKAMRDSGFSQGLEVVGNSSVFGDRGAYVASVRCIAQEGMIFFVVAGPSGDRVNRYRIEIENNLKELLELN